MSAGGFRAALGDGLFPDWEDVLHPSAIDRQEPPRFLAVLAVAYDPTTTAGTVTTPELAASAALDLTRGGGSCFTEWTVWDRQTRTLHRLEQAGFDRRSRTRGHSGRPRGTRVVDVEEHDPFDVEGVEVFVREQTWNGGGVSYDVVRLDDGELLTLDESFDRYPTPDEIAPLVETVVCKFCGKAALASRAHIHQNEWVGDECCWDHRPGSTA
ncbi:hypothetical protein [Saccharothrix sp. HUAS TT1]|uniref:hypothetical protein n=1 Tax=unclassified Saccharothrix TaxID=2593673 RepID=UPI00345C5B2E